MKTTIEIADDLFNRAREVARTEQITFRALTEQGLRMVLKEKQTKRKKFRWKPVFSHGNGLSPEFKDAPWEKIRDAIYEGHGA
jgi:hypothetical protein